MVRSDKPTLVAVVVKDFKHEPCIFDGHMTQSATVKGVSSDTHACFELQTAPLNREDVSRFKLMQKHGFTVVELPSEWIKGHRSPNDWHGYRYENDWQWKIIKCALKRITKRYEGKEGPNQVTMYDADFARTVLEEVNMRFPSPVQTLELKYGFENEPSDDELLIALAGLQRDELIEGKTLFSYTSANRKLLATANIEITAKGREFLAGTRPSLAGIAHTIIQGDQFNNYGHAGAVGPRSVGTINIQQQWTAIQNEVDFQVLTGELEQLRKHLQQNASSSSDYYRLALLSEAEEHAKNHAGNKAMEALCKIGKGALDVAKDIGTGIAAKVIAKSMGIEA